MDGMQLKEMQEWSLERKVFHTISTIQCFMSRTAETGGGYYVSFSGGADSLVLLDITRKFIDKNFLAVFCMTGNEWPEIVRFVRTFDNVEIIRPRYRMKDIIAKYGFPLISKEVSNYVYDAKTFRPESKTNKKRMGECGSKFAIPKKWVRIVDEKFLISHKCCYYLKKEPFHSYEKRTGRLPLIGTLAAESNLRKAEYLKRGGCNSFSGRIASYPMSIWTPEDIWNYINLNKIKYCEIYDKLEHKQTGCMACGYGMHISNAKLRTLLKLKPKIYEWMMQLENNGIDYRTAFRHIGVSLPDESVELF